MILQLISHMLFESILRTEILKHYLNFALSSLYMQEAFVAPARGTKRQIDSNMVSNSRFVQTKGTFQTSTILPNQIHYQQAKETTQDPAENDPLHIVAQCTV